MDTENIENEKSHLERIKKDRKLKPSAKNVLLNQHLRRYINMRKEIQNKPVKVQIVEDKLPKITKMSKGVQVVEKKDAGQQVDRNEIAEEMFEGAELALQQPPQNFGSPGEQKFDPNIRAKKTPRKHGNSTQSHLHSFYNTRKNAQKALLTKQTGSGNFIFKPTLWKKH